MRGTLTIESNAPGLQSLGRLSNCRDSSRCCRRVAALQRRVSSSAASNSWKRACRHASVRSVSRRLVRADGFESRREQVCGHAQKCLHARDPASQDRARQGEKRHESPRGHGRETDRGALSRCCRAATVAPLLRPFMTVRSTTSRPRLVAGYSRDQQSVGSVGPRSRFPHRLANVREG